MITVRRAARIRPLGVKSTRIGSIRCHSTGIEQPENATWQRPHAPGEFPLYDMALKLIQTDSERHIQRIKEMRQRLEPGSEQSNAALEEIEILSEINLPETRWRFNNNKGEFSGDI